MCCLTQGTFVISTCIICVCLNHLIILLNYSIKPPHVQLGYRVTNIQGSDYYLNVAIDELEAKTVNQDNHMCIR